MVTRLYLVRHGQSAGNAEGRFGGHSPTPLSDLGKEQAEITAQYLAKERIDAIYSSDLIRAVQTAEPLAELLDLPIIKTSAFRERKVGVLEGLTFDESKAKYPKDYYALINRNIQHVITDGESYRQLLKTRNRSFAGNPSHSSRRKSRSFFTHRRDLFFNSASTRRNPSQNTNHAVACNFQLRH